MANEPMGSDEQLVAEPTYPEFIDWLIGAAIALTGLVLLVGGSAIVLLVDRELIAQDIEDTAEPVMIGTRELTDEEMIQLAGTVIDWTGVGLLLTGITLLIVGVGYVLIRHRAYRRHAEGESMEMFLGHAFLGGVVTVLVSFIPLSPVIGGGIAGFLERAVSERAVSVGAVSGLIPTIPIIILMVFVIGGAAAALLELGEGPLAIFMVIIVLFTAIALGLFGAGLGAVGGYLGGWIRTNR